MTLANYQDFLHSLYQGDDDTPTSSETDWDVRLNLLYAAIDAWDNEQGVLWRELWTNLTAASDGTKTTVASTVDYDMPTNFRFLGGFVRTTDSSDAHTYWDVLSPQKSELFKNEDVTAAYVTGNKSTGFDIHFLKTPIAGHTINYPYYKEPSKPSETTDVIEMADPWFAVYFALSKLHEYDGEGDRASSALAMAQGKLANMKVRNEMPPSYQDNYVPDRDTELGRGGFGK